MRQSAYISFGHRIAAIFMIAALAWLTVSMPIVYKAQQQAKAESKILAAEEESTLAGNVTEEKNEGGVIQLSEYMHETNLHLQPFSEAAVAYKCHQCSFHLDIYPEFFSPPPEA